MYVVGMTDSGSVSELSLVEGDVREIVFLDSLFCLGSSSTFTRMSFSSSLGSLELHGGRFMLPCLKQRHELK